MSDAQKEDKPLVSVVTVSFNCQEFLRNCLSSLIAQTYPNVEIIAVDNGSSEDIATHLRSEFPSVRWLRLETNMGFAGGNNAGIRLASGKYIALINNDAQADPEWLNCLVDKAEADKRIAAVASLIIDGNNPQILDSCGVVVALDGMSRQAMHGESSQASYASMRVLAVSGCGCLLRMDALRQTGLFDERFFAYCEDTDLSLRLLWAGWDITTAPQARVTHFYSKTSGAFSLKKIFWIERNHYWVVIKNFPASLLAVLPMFSMWRFFCQVRAFFLGYGKIDSFVADGGYLSVAWTILTADLAALAGTISALKARKFIHTGNIRTGAEMKSLILELHVSMREIIAGSAATKVLQKLERKDS